MDSPKELASLSHVLSGLLIFRHKFYVYPADRILRQKSYLYQNEILEDIKYDGLLTRAEAHDYLVRHSLLPPDADKQIDQLDKAIEQKKVDIYNARMAKSKVKLLKDNLKSLRATQNKLYADKFSLDHATQEGYTELCRLRYLILNSVKNKAGKKIRIEKDGILSEAIINFVNESRLSHDEIRQLAKLDSWKSIWNSSSGNPFSESYVDLTDDQRSIILFSRMYDNAYKHSEPPDDAVVDDDDMFDGWMIFQRRKAEKERKEASLDKQFGDSDMISYPAHNLEQVKEIEEMNDPTSRAIKVQREKFIQKQGTKVKESQLPDIQQELQMQANKQFAEKMKRGK